jgi:hypothetical protein
MNAVVDIVHASAGRSASVRSTDMTYLRHPGAQMTVLSAAGYVTLAALWHISANRLVVSEATRELLKDGCAATAALLFLIVSVYLTSANSIAGIVRGAFQSATGIAVGAFCLAVIHGLNTDWGVQCNQCGGYQWLLIWPLGAAILAFILSSMVAGIAAGVRRAASCLTNRLSGRV